MQETGNYREIHTWIGLEAQTGYWVGKRRNVPPDLLTAADPIPAWLSPVAGDDLTGGGPVGTADTRVRSYTAVRKNTFRSCMYTSLLLGPTRRPVCPPRGLMPVGVVAFSFSSTVHRCCESDPYRNLAAACQCQYSWSYAKTEAQMYLNASSLIFAV